MVIIIIVIEYVFKLPFLDLLVFLTLSFFRVLQVSNFILADGMGVISKEGTHQRRKKQEQNLLRAGSRTYQQKQLHFSINM